MVIMVLEPEIRVFFCGFMVFSMFWWAPQAGAESLGLRRSWSLSRLEVVMGSRLSRARSWPSP